MPPVVSPPPRTPLATSTKQEQRLASPSYFGLTPDPNSNPLLTANRRLARSSQSPASVRSAAASPPSTFPVASTPKFDAFRKQSESGSFDLNQFAFPAVATPRPAATRPSLSRRTTKQDHALSVESKPASLPKADTIQAGEIEHDQSDVSRSPKRILSSTEASIINRNRTQSPQSYVNQPPSVGSGFSSKLHNQAPRLSLGNATTPPAPARQMRAETLPATLEHEGPVFVAPQHVVNILDADDEDPLLLDLRVSTQYSKSRIRGALNLCIPTTLLKRASYNVARLAETFKIATQREQFERWRECSCIIVYDTSASQSKDALNCLNILKKFESEGWKGPLIILRGGFVDFARSFSSFVDERSHWSAQSSSSSLILDTQSQLPPVIGGCPMPEQKSAANPFFSNIRQNMDLIDGVGQMPIKIPATMSRHDISELPQWLRKAVDEKDNGKTVADKFLHIERKEQSRMQEALSDTVAFGVPSSHGTKPIQVAGIEKGAKNRYNNIYPYEHTRVKLQGIPAHDCDYVNANHVKSTYSNKRFIATQAPIPHTFGDFWSMIWQNDVRVIVMLTNETEGGQIKAHNYWSEQSYGPMKLNFLSEHRASLEVAKIQRHKSRPSMDKRRSSTHGHSSSSSNKSSTKVSDQSPDEQTPVVVVRKFALAHQDHPFERMREITQLHYSHWPDFGAPASASHVLGLVEQCDAVVRYARNNSVSGDLETPVERPVVVHCSAGCGRTGTFCTVDTVLDMLKQQRNTKYKRHGPWSDASPEAEKKSAETLWTHRDDLDLVEKTVEEFRHQRLSMVQSLRQFVLCYEAVLEWIVSQNVPKTA